KNLPAFVGRFERWQRRGDLRWRNAVLQGNRASRQNIVDVVSAQQRARERLTKPAGHQVETRPSGSQQFDVFRSRIGGRLQPEHHHGSVKITAELGNIFIVGVQENRTTARKGSY